MSVLSILLLILFIIVCVLLIFFVIIQDEDSGSLGGVFAGGSGSAFGSRTSSVVVKITYVLGALFFVLAFSMALINKSPTSNIQQVVNEQQKTEQTTNSEWWKGNDQSGSSGAQSGTTSPASGTTNGAAQTVPSTTPTTTK
ncbi:MAG: preprotein translocase subunit SecG [Spirochaetaceae bacterium]|nr:preprotein translocase subunit SecG [Spirochaetaceae bacterium]